MSVTVVSLPVLLIYGVVAAATTTVNIAGEAATTSEYQNTKSQELQNRIKQSIEENNGCMTEELMQEFCKEFETVFMDKDILIKTLDEHGLKNIECEGENIQGQIENFTVSFSRENTNLPYKMKISCTQQQDETNMVQDINTEYAMNVQEETYIKLKERLKEKHMEIEHEEVLDDDSIVITVNID